MYHVCVSLSQQIYIYIYMWWWWLTRPLCDIKHGIMLMGERVANLLPTLLGVCVALSVFFFSVQRGWLQALLWSGDDGAANLQEIWRTSTPTLRVTAGSSCNCSLDHEQFKRTSSEEPSIGCICPSAGSTFPCPREQPVSQLCRPEEKPWYAKGKAWHYPVKFPRCSMDACFNYSRCNASAADLLIYTYADPSRVPPHYFSGINTTRWHTPDPDKACLFFVFVNTVDLKTLGKHPSQLFPHLWNNGLNHVLITFAYQWRLARIPPESIGLASVMITDMHQTTYRPGFDVSIPLPPKRHSSQELRQLKPYERKYLLTFRGLRYVSPNLTGEGDLRSFDAFRHMHNGRDVIVATSCNHPVNDERRRQDPSLGAHCDEDDAVYGTYNFDDLMNSTFGLAPAGVQSATYRFSEILSAGSIPVLVADNHVKPLDSLVQWQHCILQFPSTEMHRILPAIRAIRRREAERRQAYCLAVYHRFFASNAALLRGAIQAQKAKFMGTFPRWGGDEF